MQQILALSSLTFSLLALASPKTFAVIGAKL